jgi:hypothetical protein
MSVLNKEKFFLSSGFSTIQTPYHFPDGSMISCFQKTGEDGRVVLSDLGDLYQYLINKDIEILSDVNRAITDELLAQHHVERDKGILYIDLGYGKDMTFSKAMGALVGVMIELVERFNR